MKFPYNILARYLFLPIYIFIYCKRKQFSLNYLSFELQKVTLVIRVSDEVDIVLA